MSSNDNILETLGIIEKVIRRYHRGTDDDYILHCIKTSNLTIFHRHYPSKLDLSNIINLLHHIEGKGDIVVNFIKRGYCECIIESKLIDLNEFADLPDKIAPLPTINKN